MHLILCEDTDPSARWLVERLGAAGLDPVVASPAALAAGVNWHHEVTDAGAWFHVELSDGRTLDSRDVHGTVNRVHAMVPPGITTSEDGERIYAEQEFAALALSVLASLPEPILNPPTAQGLCGANKHPSELMWAASQAGLATLPYVFDSRAIDDASCGWTPPLPPGAPVNTVFVVEGEVVGAVPPGSRRGCVELASALGQPLVGIDFLHVADGRHVFVGASPCPPLASGGDELVDALTRALQGKPDDRT